MKEGLWQLIIVVVLASLIDVCAPAGTMRQYVRLVLSLLVLLALLTPLAQLWRVDVHAELRKSFSINATQQDVPQDVRMRGEALQTMLVATAQTHASDIVAQSIEAAMHERGYAHARVDVQLPNVAITLGQPDSYGSIFDKKEDVMDVLAAWISDRFGIAREHIQFL